MELVSWTPFSPKFHNIWGEKNLNQIQTSTKSKPQPNPNLIQIQTLTKSKP